MEFHSIEDVVNALDAIVQHCESTKNRAGYFAALYKRMTMAVRDGIAKGMFEDGPRMEQLDITFAKRYLDAWESYQKPATCSASWQCAFDNCSNKNLTVIQQLILGINTHINLDLAIAAAAAAPGNSIHALANDFNRINDVIASLVNNIQQCLEAVWAPMRLLDRIANRPEQSVLNFSIGIARKTAWTNATILAQMNPQQQQEQIKLMDTMVNAIGHKVIHPGLGMEALLKVIRLTEYEDVARTIRLIDITGVDVMK